MDIIMMPAINNAGTINLPFKYGTLNLDCGLSGIFCKTRIPPHTKTNANKVPILVSESTVLKFRNNAGTATSTPVNMVEKEGVRNFGWSFENIFGKSPSRLMLIHMRGCPIWKTSSTLAVAIIALKATIPAIQCKPLCSKTKANGSPTLSSL